jgi:2-keto-3-deoxy-L-rhamnonate aldolase RhmA
MVKKRNFGLLVASATRHSWGEILGIANMNRITTHRLKAIRRALDDNQPLTGAWLFMGCPAAADVLAQGDFDFLILDLEHAPGTNETMYNQIRACDAEGMPVVVRLPRPDLALAVQALDAGAAGIAISDIRTDTQVAELVQITQYAPAGKRGTHRLARAAGFGLRWNEYLNEIAPDLLRIALIESSEGALAAEQICAVKGLDAVFIGGVDLATSLGHLDEPQHPEVTAAKELIVQAAAKANVAVGGLAGTVEDANRLFDDGYSIATVGSDLSWLRDKVVSLSGEISSAKAME